MKKDQTTFFESGVTRRLEFRLAALDTLRQAIKRYETDILEALESDLGKSAFEGYATEVGMVYEEIRFARKHLKNWARPRRVGTPLAQLPSKSYIYKEPLGSVLIIAPWNYPFQLALSPLVGAIAAGNTVVIKPSELSPAVSDILDKLISETFQPEYIKVIQGGVYTTQRLLEQKFDHVFFTGSTRVGRIIAQKTAETLTPVTLELGGKSPCIVDETADIPLAAKRIAWGKFLNAGQTCVAPDYILCHHSVFKALVKGLEEAVNSFWPGGALCHSDYPKIINEAHFQRLCTLMEGGTVRLGGKWDESKRKIEPTILVDVKKGSPLMQEEIFGPLLPILVYRDIREIPGMVLDKPLSLYLFSQSKDHERFLMEQIPFGGGCVNDTIVHLTNPRLPFGGVGQSGMGAYHGKKSFDCFSHEKSVLKKAGWLDIPLRYPPYEGKLRMIRRFLK